jgi:hypothetical protein
MVCVDRHLAVCFPDPKEGLNMNDMQCLELSADELVQVSGAGLLYDLYRALREYLHVPDSCFTD